MSVYRHKHSPFWQFDFQIRGRRFSGSTLLTDKGDAEAFEKSEKAKARATIDADIRADKQPMTVGRACQRWWEELGCHMNDSGLKTSLDWLVDQLGERRQLSAINDDDVSRLVQARRGAKVRAGRVRDAKGRVTQLYRPITARTVNKTTVVLLRRVMRRARDNWTVAIPDEPTWKNHLLKQTRRAIREITIAEEADLDAIEDSDFADLRRFAIITGLRRGNVLVKKSQVDFNLAVIRVIAKGGVPRIIPLSKEAYEILWRRQSHHETDFFTFVAQRTRTCPKTGREFVKGKRYPITYYGMGSNKRKWKKAGVAARIHDLRHTTGSRTLRRTGNLKLVQTLLGHTDIKITAEFYANVTIDDVRAAMDATAEATPRPRPAEKKETGQ